MRARSSNDHARVWPRGRSRICLDGWSRQSSSPPGSNVPSRFECSWICMTRWVHSRKFTALTGWRFEGRGCKRGPTIVHQHNRVWQFSRNHVTLRNGLRRTPQCFWSVRKVCPERYIALSGTGGVIEKVARWMDEQATRIRGKMRLRFRDSELCLRNAENYSGFQCKCNWG